MPKQVFQCSLTGEVFDTHKQAEECEHQAAWNIIEKSFPKYHNLDDSYKMHCVDTGELLVKCETEWDGHRNKVGPVKYRASKAIFMSGWRTLEAHKAAVLRLAKMIKFWNDNHEE